MQDNISAVTFDVEAFAAWLDGPSTAGTAAPINRDVHSALATAYQQHDGEAGWLVEQLLDWLRTAPQVGTPVWAYGPGVTDVRVWATAAAEDGPDGGLAGEVIVDGVVLSLGKLAEKDLIPSDALVMPGHEAAAHALSALAAQVNAVAGAYRSNRAAGLASRFTGEQLDQALTVMAKMWQFARTGQPKNVTVTGEHRATADAVLAAVEDSKPVDGVIVDDGKPYSAYDTQAAAVDHDYCNPAHPAHW
jgi:hypothetical protein